MVDNFYSHDYLPQDVNSYRANSLSPEPRQASASPSDHRQLLFTELSTIEGSCEITTKSVEDKGVKGENGDEDLGIGAERRDQSNGQPLQPSRTPTGDVRKVQSHSIEDITKQQSPDHHHQRSSSGGAMHARNNNSMNASPAKGGASEVTGQPETFRSQESVGVTITVSTEMDIVTQESTQITSNQLETDAQLDSAATTLNGKTGLEEDPNQLKEFEEDRHHNIEQLNTDGSNDVAPKEEPQENTTKKPENMEWVGDSCACSVAVLNISYC